MKNKFVKLRKDIWNRDSLINIILYYIVHVFGLTSGEKLTDEAASILEY